VYERDMREVVSPFHRMTLSHDKTFGGGNLGWRCVRLTASTGLRRAVGALLHHAQRAGVVRDDVELPEVYTLLVATSRAAARTDVDDEP
jgi:hypothetical protein